MRFLYLFILTFIIAHLTNIPLVRTQPSPTSNNQTFFTGEPPSLVSANTPYPDIGWPYPRYFFTFNLPPSSPQSLGQVTIAPETNLETIAFNLSSTQAVEGTTKDKGKKLNLLSVTQEPQTQVITINFDPPVPPGTIFTISLEAKQNPSQSGVYLFRVQGFPAGNNPIGLDLGVGRLSFYQPF